MSETLWLVALVAVPSIIILGYLLLLDQKCGLLQEKLKLFEAKLDLVDEINAQQGEINRSQGEINTRQDEIWDLLGQRCRQLKKYVDVTNERIDKLYAQYSEHKKGETDNDTQH